MAFRLAKHCQAISFNEKPTDKARQIICTLQGSSGDFVVDLDVLSREPGVALFTLEFPLQAIVRLRL